MNSDIIQQYTRGEIYSCLLKTAKETGIDESIILTILDESDKYKGIKEQTEIYIKSINSPSRHLRILSGPHILVFFRDLSGKKILLLGERHETSNLCSDTLLEENYAYEVHKWLVQIAIDAPSCVDIFTETYYKNIGKCKEKGKLSTFSAPLSAVECEFERLINDGDLPPYVRYHNIDIRLLEGIQFPISEWTMKVFSKTNLGGQEGLYMFIKITQTRHMFSGQESVLIGHLLTMDRSENARKIHDEFMHELFQKASLAYDKNKYSLIYDKYVRLIDKEFSKSSLDKNKTLLLLSNIYLRDINKSHFDLYSILLAIPMDLYFLVRLFIKFDETKLQRGPKGCRMKKDVTANNVIVYGGAQHIKIYTEFFESYFNIVEPTLMIGDINNESQCIEFDEPFDFYTY